MTLLSTDKIVDPNASGRKKITYREYLATEPQGARTESVDGEIVQRAPISDKHQTLAGSF